MSTPITAIREGTRFTQATAALAITAFLSLILSPSAAAAKDALQNVPSPRAAAAVPAPPPDTLNDALRQAKAALQRLDAQLDRGAMPAALAADLQALATLKSALVEADREVMATFRADGDHLQRHKLPAVIQQRHAAAVADYQARHRAMLGHLNGLTTTADAVTLKARVKAARTWLEALPLDRARVPFDPNQLPFRVETQKARVPKLTAKELQALFPARVNPPLKTSARSGDSVFLDTQTPLQVASAGSLTGLLAVAALTPPGPEFLAPTDDVPITPAIQALAAELHHQPVAIYNWVRNHIEWIPSYGSVQGSQLTLDKKAGNAFDTASLLIALLRASGIPARYVYGAIELPIDQVLNWAGGFTSADAAINFLATGGIPTAGLVRGGQIAAVRMEHVWVEAFVDYHPSRGAVNRVPDMWVPLDASYKQYTYTEGMELQSDVPFDAHDFLTQAQQGATSNEQEGWVQNLNQANIQAQLSQYQQQLQAYIENQNPDATVGQVLGAKTIRMLNAPTLAATLPYRKLAQAGTYADLPDALKHKFRYSLYTEEHQRSIENPVFTYEEKTANLAGKKVTLAFVPATDDDRQAIESYLPQPHEDGSPIQPEEFPQSLPGYGIRVTAELRVEGEVVTRGGAFSLGTELLGEGGFTTMDLTGWDLSTDPLVAGQTGALGISLQGIAAGQLTDLKARLETTKAKLEQNDFANLTGEHLSGDLLAATVWSYFAATESFGRIAQRSASMVDNPALSYGFFHAMVVPVKRYGMVVQVRFPGVVMDIGHQRRIATSKINDTATWVTYNRMRGKHGSAMEHAIPERYFDDPNDTQTTEGISAVKALAVAARQGQRTYTITPANQAQLANVHQSSAVMENIRNALNAGKEVTVHEHPITHAGFNGAGYVITDPQTGAGAYLIEGGANGAIIVIFLLIAFIALAPILIIGEVTLLSVVAAGLAISQAIQFAEKLEKIVELDPKEQWDILNGYIFLLTLEALTVAFMAVKQAESVGFELFEYEVWDVIWGLCWGLVDKLFGIGS